MKVVIEVHPGPGPRWWVVASDGVQEWSESYWTAEEAESVAADIEQGLMDPWDDQ